jgi:hypothetical protein
MNTDALEKEKCYCKLEEIVFIVVMGVPIASMSISLIITTIDNWMRFH